SVGGFYSSTFSINSAGSGASGHSLSFDGVDDKVFAQSIIFQNDDSLSISMWLKPESFSSTSTNTFLRQDQCSSGDTRIYLANENGSLAFGLTTNSGWHEWDLSYSMNSLLGSWNHLTFTYGSNVKKIFINGVLQGTNSGNSGNMLTCNNGYLIFGSNISARYYNGNMDEVAIWDDVLTEMEVAALYNSGNPLTASTNSGYYTSSSNLKGYWQLNEGSGTYTTDGSGNGNPGTISGATWSTDIPGSSTTSSSGGDDDGSIELLTGSSESGVSGNEQGYPLNSYYHDV
ncbi:uncharacterized protein METZ01_LOCUS396994, partial [marine metagenome]